MATALHQNGIFDIDDIWNFDLENENEFENCFSSYKEIDANFGKNKGRDISIICGIKCTFVGSSFGVPIP